MHYCLSVSSSQITAVVLYYIINDSMEVLFILLLSVSKTEMKDCTLCHTQLESPAVRIISNGRPAIVFVAVKMGNTYGF